MFRHISDIFYLQSQDVTMVLLSRSCVSPFFDVFSCAEREGLSRQHAVLIVVLALYLILETDDGYAVGEWFYITW